MQEFKLRHSIFIRAVGTAAGRWTQRVDVPFAPKYCIVRQVVYNQNHGVALVRAPFVQGGVLCVLNGDSNPSTEFMLSTSSPVSGDYEFQAVTVQGAAVNMAAGGAGNIVIVLEFVA